MKNECPYHDQDGLDVCNCEMTDKLKEEEWWSPLAIPSNETCRGHRYVDYDHIPKIIAKTKHDIKSLLLANGHGGGNWRRLVDQL